jgi:hypothetical protein
MLLVFFFFSNTDLEQENLSKTDRLGVFFVVLFFWENKDRNGVI